LAFKPNEKVIFLGNRLSFENGVPPEIERPFSLCFPPLQNITSRNLVGAANVSHMARTTGHVPDAGNDLEPRGKASE